MALTGTSKEVIWMPSLLHEIENRDVEIFSTNIQHFHNVSTNQREQMDDVDPPQSSWAAATIFVENQGAAKLAENPQFHNHTKHIDIRYHFIRDTLAAGEIVLRYQPMGDVVADIMTKPLPHEKDEKHFGAMELHSASVKVSPRGADDEDAIMLA